MKIMDKLRTNRLLLAGGLAVGILAASACEPKTGTAGEDNVKAYKWPNEVVHGVEVDHEGAGASNKRNRSKFHDLECEFLARRAGNTVMFLARVVNEDVDANGALPKGMWGEYVITREEIRAPDERAKSKRLSATIFWSDPDGEVKELGASELDLHIRYPMGDDVYTLPCGPTDIFEADKVFNWPIGSQQKYVMSTDVPQP
jgi:hypothetical protein